MPLTLPDLQELRDFVGGLLVRKPEYRMGCGKDGVDEVKSHVWFKGFDWDAFAQRKMAPPYLPKVRCCQGDDKLHYTF